MSVPVKTWHMEHVYFRRLLQRLQKEVDVFAAGERPNYELMLDIITYLTQFTDAVHHRREDVAFERLVRRLPEMQLPIARLQQEHRVIAHAGETLRQLLASVLDGSVLRRAEVETAAATYLVYYGSHIAKEEEDILTRAAAELTREDWDAVRQAVPQADDPLFGHEPNARFRQLRRQIDLQDQDAAA